MFQSLALVTTGAAPGIVDLVVIAAIFVIAALLSDSTSPAAS